MNYYYYIIIEWGDLPMLDLKGEGTQSIGGRMGWGILLYLKSAEAGKYGRGQSKEVGWQREEMPPQE